MSKIVINKNLAKYYYKFVDSVMKPNVTHSTITGYASPTAGGVISTFSTIRDYVVTKQSTLDTLDKISRFYNSSFSYNALGWFSTDAQNTNPYNKGVLTNTYDFGKEVYVMNLTTSASSGNPTGYPTTPFKLYTSTDGTDWTEAYSSTVNLTTVKVHTLNLTTRYIKIIADGNVFISPNTGFLIRGLEATNQIINYTTDLGIIITQILIESSRASTLASLVSNGVITQAEKDAMLLINLTDRPVVTSSLTNDVVKFTMTNPNKLVRRYVKSTDNTNNETLYLLFPNYTYAPFSAVNHIATTICHYVSTRSEKSEQALSYIAISMGTTGTEDIVLDYADNIDYLDDMDIKIKLPTIINI